jgi:hypothetical protein
MSDGASAASVVSIDRTTGKAAEVRWNETESPASPENRYRRAGRPAWWSEAQSVARRESLRVDPSVSVPASHAWRIIVTGTRVGTASGASEVRRRVSR